MKADVFEYLVIVSSIIRPAANVFADEFVRRAHGQRYRSLHPILDEVLAETHGIMVYQEDVMKVAVALGGSLSRMVTNSVRCSARSIRPDSSVTTGNSSTPVPQHVESNFK